MSAADPAVDYQHAILDVWATNDRLNQMLITSIDEGAWRASPPGRMRRTPASLFAHIHNSRLMWLKQVARHKKLPAKLDGAKCSRRQAGATLARSATAVGEVLAAALAQPGGRIAQFGAPFAFFNYLAWHEAHHRGQILTLARLAGYALPEDATYGIWITLRQRGLAASR